MAIVWVVSADNETEKMKNCYPLTIAVEDRRLAQWSKGMARRKAGRITKSAPIVALGDSGAGLAL